MARSSGSNWRRDLYIDRWPRLCRELERAFDAGPNRFVFRGEADPMWRLNPTLFRAWHSRRDDGGAEALCRVEREVLAGFRAQAPNYGASCASSLTELDWLGLLQHYSGPTRLLDWTFSPFVALFFAVGDGRRAAPRRDFVVWALDQTRLADRVHQLARQAGLELPRPCIPPCRYTSDAAYRRVFLQEEVPLVLPVMPAACHRRLATQQGLFLCPNRTVTDLPDLLDRMFHGSKHAPFTRILVSGSLRAEAARRLDAMNISPTSLFDGLEALGAELCRHVVNPRRDPPARRPALQRPKAPRKRAR